MANNAVIHDCSKCALHKRKIDKQVDRRDIDVYKLLQTRIDNAVQASRLDALDAIDNMLTKEQKAEYYEKALKNVDDVQDLINEWWDLMKMKYKIPESSKVDYEEYCFFECVDDDEKPSLTGEYTPREGVKED